jgi:hypothetical protein
MVSGWMGRLGDVTGGVVGVMLKWGHAAKPNRLALENIAT